VRIEVTKEQLDSFLAANPGLEFDGLRYTERVQMKGLVWKKPLAYTQDGKHYLIERAQ